MATLDNTKPTMQQSMADLTLSLRTTMKKISPHLGFAYLTLMLIGITTVVYIVSQTMQSTDVGAGTVTNEKMSEYVIPFDHNTIQKVEALSNDNGALNVTLPHGRINPFSESVY